MLLIRADGMHALFWVGGRVRAVLLCPGARCPCPIAGEFIAVKLTALQGN